MSAKIQFKTDIVKRYLNGESSYQIAKSEGCTPNTVRYQLIKNGVKTDKYKGWQKGKLHSEKWKEKTREAIRRRWEKSGNLWTKEQNELLEKMWSDFSISVKQIAEKLNRTESSIYWKARKKGLDNLQKRPTIYHNKICERCKKEYIPTAGGPQKYCVECRKIISKESDKNGWRRYYLKYKEKEAKRKAIWFQKNKARIIEHQREYDRRRNGLTRFFKKWDTILKREKKQQKKEQHLETFLNSRDVEELKTNKETIIFRLKKWNKEFYQNHENEILSWIEQGKKRKIFKLLRRADKRLQKKFLTRKLYYEKTKAKKFEYLKKWKEKNIDRYRKVRRDYQKRIRMLNPKLRLDENIGNAISTALKGEKAGRKWEILVGYTLEDLIKHLESRFDSQMNWENYGLYWEVDHIKPRALFYYTTSNDPQFKECWALDNLQPMEKIENIKKGKKYKINL